jgi:hypothetical protein
MPIIDRLGWLADRAGALPATTVRSELAALTDLLHKQVLPHESSDDATLYPKVSRLIGGDEQYAS